jgi:hypothetical protein
VGLTGANEYFKVDYSRPRVISGRFAHPARKAALPFNSSNSRQLNGNMDSAIVIVLPLNINVPDTFCVTYYAYDRTGNISNPITQCIIINSVGTDANGAWIASNWKFTATWGAGYHDTLTYNRWLVEENYYCYSDSVSGNSHLSPMENGTTPIAFDSIYYRKAGLSFAQNGGMLYQFDASRRSVDFTMNTSCNAMYKSSTDNYSITGAWTFNSTTNKIIMVFEFDDMGIPVEEIWEYDVTKVNNNHFIMIDNADPLDPYFYRMEK